MNDPDPRARSVRLSGLAFDLRCRVREVLVTFIQREYPDCLPQVRGRLEKDTNAVGITKVAPARE